MQSRRLLVVGLTIFAVLVSAIGAYAVIKGVAPLPPAHSAQSTAPSSNHILAPSPSSTSSDHYLYIALEGSVAVYNIDHNFDEVGTIDLPQTSNHGIRGIGVSPSTHILYVSFGGDGGSNGTGSLTAYNLVTKQTLWTQQYNHGIDSFAINRDGSTIYMPDGELSSAGLWHVVNAATGVETGAVMDTAVGTGDNGPHNTVIGLSGRYVYFGDRNLASSGSNYLYGADTSSNQIVRKVGPFQSGIRPFSVDSSETFVYTSVTGYLGFQVGNLSTGKVLYTVPIQEPAGAACSNSGASDPSHGISLSPDNRQLYVIDFTCNYVHVFDVSNVANAMPTQIAAIPVHQFDPNQPNCTYDCLGDGWLLHSSDGKYVFVGDSGDVIDTASSRVVAHITNLYNSRVFIEADWSNGVPTFTTTRSGIGR